MTDVRVGQGFDVHRYAVGRRLVLCGLELGGTRLLRLLLLVRLPRRRVGIFR